MKSAQPTISDSRFLVGAMEIDCVHWYHPAEPEAYEFTGDSLPAPFSFVSSRIEPIVKNTPVEGVVHV